MVEGGTRNRRRVVLVQVELKELVVGDCRAVTRAAGGRAQAGVISPDLGAGGSLAIAGDVPG